MARVLIVGEGSLEGTPHVVDGGEGIDPGRLVTLTPRLEGVSVLCWLAGPCDALESLLEYLVDTPVRGVVYQRTEAYPQGEQIVARARQTFRMPCEVISAGDDLAAAVDRVLLG